MILLVFVIWFPVYLVWVRPVIDRWVFQYAHSYPVELYVVPALALPILAALGYRGLMMWRYRDRK